MCVNETSQIEFSSLVTKIELLFDDLSSLAVSTVGKLHQEVPSLIHERSDLGNLLFSIGFGLGVLEYVPAYSTGIS